MSRTCLTATLCAISLLTPALLPAAEPTDELDVREIMRRVEDRDDGDDGIADLEMTLIDRHGNKRVRQIRFFMKKFAQDTYRTLFFTEPADVRDTAFLTYDYKDRGEDDLWLYLPALKKTKRIPGADKSDSFMGSDFTFADMTARVNDRYDYRMLGESEVDGHAVWEIEAIPRTQAEIDERSYVKSILWVRQDNFFVLRSANLTTRPGIVKYMEVTDLDQIQGIWVPLEMTMTTKQGQATLHKTIFRFHDVRYYQDLDEAVFTVRQIEKGL